MHLKSTVLFFCITLMGGLAHSLPASGSNYAVSSAHPLATQAGVEILEQGGNAADAATAVAFVLAVVEPYSSGLGGGGFALTQFKSNVEFLDFRETAPAAAHRDMYIVDGVPRNDLSRDGILSVAVPGAILGYLELHERHGVLARERVLKSAVDLATKGFPVTPRYQKYATWRQKLLSSDAYTASIFLSKNDTGGWSVPALGTMIRQPDLAKTLEILTNDGAAAFYSGELGDGFITDIKRRGGILSRKDLATYRTKTRTPLFGHFKGHLIASSPPPSSGGAIILTTLGILEHATPPKSPRDADWLHTTIEAWKHAYADRALLGDTDFVPSARKLLPRLTAPKRAYRLAQTLDTHARDAQTVYAGAGIDPSGISVNLTTSFDDNASADTSHLSVVDGDGNAVAMTTTVNYGFGSGIVARGSGILLNDEMDDFSVAPGVPNAYGIVGSEANAVEPGKVPLSSMSPTFVFQGKTVKSGLKMVLGSPGGSRIPTTVMQAIWNHVLFGMNAQDAINFPRVHHQHLPDIVFVEAHGLDPMTQEALKARGHTLKVGKTWSNATIIVRDQKTGRLDAAADKRGDGTATAR